MFAQDGQTVFRWTTTQLEGIARDVCDRSGIKPTDLVGVVLHQANLRIIDPVIAKLGIDEDVVVVARDVEVSGNTSAASIPMAFAKLDQAGRFRAGGPVLLLGFGGGLSYAGLVVNAP